MKLRRCLIMLLPFPFLFIALVSSAAISTTKHATNIPKLATKPLSGSVAMPTTMNSSPSKRDISLSYSATDIDSKEGARFKTITVIKNLNKDGNSEKLSINPALHKNEHWADAFRDNFDSYGTIPDVPDIDDLFEFMNKKSKMKPKMKSDNRPETMKSSPQQPSQQTQPEAATSKPQMQPHSMTSTTPQSKSFMGKTDEQNVKPVVESAIETFDLKSSNAKPVASMPSPSLPQSPPASSSMSMAANNKSRTDTNLNTQKSSPTVEKIQGDAELVPKVSSSNAQKRHKSKNNNNNNNRDMVRSQSLSLTNERIIEPLVNVNYSTPQHSVHQYFEKYINENTNKGYNYQQPQPHPQPHPQAQPCANFPGNTVSVTTPSGRTYDIPRTNSAVGANNGIINPYIAPSVMKKPPAQQQPQQFPPIPLNPSLPIYPPYNQAQPPTYSVNSIVPPLQPTPAQLPATITSNVQQQQQQPQQTVGNPQQPQYINNFSTSQRPYVAPNLRNGLGYNRGPSSTPIYNTVTGAPTYRTNLYGATKLNIGRSRGLKY